MEQGKESGASKFDAEGMVLPSCIPVDDWVRWVRYRRKRKLTTIEETMTAQVQFLTEQHAQGHSPPAIIAAAITAGWQGLFAPKAGTGAFQPEPVRRQAREVYQ